MHIHRSYLDAPCSHHIIVISTLSKGSANIILKGYPLVNIQKAIEIVDFPIKNGRSFHSYVNVYQRVNHVKNAMVFQA